MERPIHPAFEAMHRTVLVTFGQDGMLDGVPLRLVMDHLWRPPDIGGVRTALVEPCCYVMTADAPQARVGSVLESLARTYEIVRLERLEHHAMIKLVLRPANMDGVPGVEY